MKVGYPDTINNKAYQGEKSPFKMVDKSKADLDKDGKVSDYEENRAEAAFGDAPLNYSPVKSRDALGTRIYEGPGNQSSTVKKDGGMSSMNNNNFKPTTTTKKTVTPETPTTNNRTATKTTRIVKGKGGPKMSTLGVEIYKGIGRLVKKRKAKRAAKKVDKDTPGTEANLRAMVAKNEKYQKANPPSSRKKKENSPAKFASAAQRKAVWASKNEKKKK